MVLEAALVFPFFLFFVIFLIYIVQMTLISTALQSTASDTVKMVSSHMYPVSLVIKQEAASEESSGGVKLTDDWLIPKLSVTDWASEYSDSLPAPLNEWVLDAIRQGEMPLQDVKTSVSEAVLDPVVKPILKPFMQSKVLNYDRIHVSNIRIPNLKTRENPYFGIELSYELPIRVPLINKKIVLQARSEERIWIGATAPIADTGEGEGEDSASKIEVLEKPNPAVVGSKTKLRIKMEPNAKVNLSVFYKSGQSTAKYLGWKQADAEGYVEWEWSVGPNTTPGTWPLIITTEDGQRTEVMFTVVPRNSG